MHLMISSGNDTVSQAIKLMRNLDTVHSTFSSSLQYNETNYEFLV